MMSKSSKQKKAPAPLGNLSPAASQLARRAGAYAQLAQVGGAAMGARMREGRLAKARLAVDPDGQLAPEERERRAEAQVKSDQCRALAKAHQANAEGRARKQRSAARAARATRGPQSARQAQAQAQGQAQATRQAAVAQTTAQERAAKRARWAAYWGGEPDVASEAAAEAALWDADGESEA